ncbi:mitochondrial ribosomal protein subunit s18 [Phlyctema vagabunda]|uniref:Mitochondrial ribosomal protein subunit s18 n=1 Tax=Phlyctema vagabunda TaxID=108571 RepID=A0ABR4PWU6_9HELO
MSRSSARRLLAKSPFPFKSESTPVSRIQSPCFRLFSQSSRTGADESEIRNPTTASAPKSPFPKAGTSKGPMSELAGGFGAILNQNQQSRMPRANYPTASSELSLLNKEKYTEPHHLHVYAHRKNCHITLTRPDRSPILSVSCGQIGFKNAARKTYDAAFQLASFAMGRITDRGIHLQIEKLEVTMRGFGLGREAVTKALMGSEGRFLRGKVIRVQDATRLKFGGTRSRKPRRLG